MLPDGGVLFEMWRKRHKANGWTHFIYDGIVSEVDWNRPDNKRICFFLKEAYLKENEKPSLKTWNLTDSLAHGLDKRLWKRIALWVYGINGTTETTIPSYAEAQALTREQRHTLLSQIAVVNVKKSEGKPGSDENNLLSVACEDKDLLLRELELIQPKIIVCGYTAGLLRFLFGAKTDGHTVDRNSGAISWEQLTRNGYFWLGDCLVLDCYHPANHFPAQLNYYTVCCLYQQALKERR